MEGKRSIQQIEIEGKVPIRIYASPNNKRYFIAFDDGSLEIRTSDKFENIEKTIYNQGYIL